MLCQTTAKHFHVKIQTDTPTTIVVVLYIGIGIIYNIYTRMIYTYICLCMPQMCHISTTMI